MSETVSALSIKAAAITDVGILRSINQDQVFCSLEPIGVLPNLFIVADGLGGHKAGDLASSEAVRYYTDYIIEHATEADDVMVLMKTALEMTNRYIYFLSKESDDYVGMGTTFVAATVIGDKLHCINVGDSRLYAVNKPIGQHPLTLEQITEDHSIVEMMFRKGLITEEEARVHPQRNMITRAIGIEQSVEIDEFEVKVSGLLRVLMCSDGLSNMVNDLELLSLLTASNEQGMKTVDETVRSLIDRANENGGKDNVTALVIDFVKEGETNA